MCSRRLRTTKQKSSVSLCLSCMSCTLQTNKCHVVEQCDINVAGAHSVSHLQSNKLGITEVLLTSSNSYSESAA